MKLFFITLIFAGFHLQAQAYLNPPQVISLLPPGAHEILERENQINSLCPPDRTKNLEKCLEEKLEPVSWELNLYKDAYENAAKVGKIRIKATPGKGLSAEFSTDEKKWLPLESDSKQTDWGYSSYFEFTLKDVRNDWLQLPKRPFAEPVWINLKKDWQLKNKDEVLPTPSQLETEAVYTVKSLGNIVVLKFSGQNIVYRNENKNDMLCGEEPQPIPKNQLIELTRSVNILYDSDGHLQAWPAYPRGC